MALPWIKVYTSLPTHHKADHLEDLLNAPMAWAHVVQLWLWAAHQNTHGNLTKYSERAISRHAGWTGDPHLFCSALVKSGFMSNKKLIINWEKHNGAYERKLAKNKESYKTKTLYAAESRNSATESGINPTDDRHRGEERREEERKEEEKREIHLDKEFQNEPIPKKRTKTNKRSHESIEALLADIPATFNKKKNQDRRTLLELLETQYPSLDVESLASAAWDHHTHPKSRTRDMAAALKNWLQNQVEWKRPKKYKDEKDTQRASLRPNSDLKGNRINPPDGYLWRQADDYARESGWEWSDEPDSVGSHWRTTKTEPPAKQEPEPYDSDFAPPWRELKERARKPACQQDQPEEQPKKKKQDGGKKHSNSQQPNDTETTPSLSQFASTAPQERS